MPSIEVICIECGIHFVIDSDNIVKPGPIADKGQIQKESRDYIVFCPKDHPNKIPL